MAIGSRATSGSAARRPPSAAAWRAGALRLRGPGRGCITMAPAERTMPEGARPDPKLDANLPWAGARRGAGGSDCARHHGDDHFAKEPDCRGQFWWRANATPISKRPWIDMPWVCLGSSCLWSIMGVVHGRPKVRSSGLGPEKGRSPLGFRRCSVFPAASLAAEPRFEVPPRSSDFGIFREVSGVLPPPLGSPPLEPKLGLALPNSGQSWPNSGQILSIRSE